MKTKIETIRSITGAAGDGLHIAIIMDGNGRWAQARGLPRSAGHRAGMEAARRVVEAAARLGVGNLTLYAFSSDNWTRPAAEVSALMELLRSYLAKEMERCADNDVRFSAIGRRDRLPESLVRSLEEAEQRTVSAAGMHLRVAIDYSARDAILRAASRVGGMREVSRALFSRLLAGPGRSVAAMPDVDLLIRTGGEQRLSDFLLWECAYAELVFTPRLWPDFGSPDLEAAIQDFRGRQRRFGGLPSVAVG